MTTSDGDDHRKSETPIGDGRDRCAVDGYLWPCPTVRQRPEALHPDGEVLADEVGVGWAIFERIPPGACYTPRGGIVVDVREEDAPDDVVVEPVNRPSDVVRVFLTLSIFRGDVVEHELRVGDFDPMLSNLPNAASMRGLARKLFAIVGASKGTVSPTELRRAEHALRLYRQVA